MGFKIKLVLADSE